MDTQIPNRIAPKIPPKLWQSPNKVEVIKIAKVRLFRPLLNLLKNIPLNKITSIIGDNITMVKK